MRGLRPSSFPVPAAAPAVGKVEVGALGCGRWLEPDSAFAWAHASNFMGAVVTHPHEPAPCAFGCTGEGGRASSHSFASRSPFERGRHFRAYGGRDVDKLPGRAVNG